MLPSPISKNGAEQSASGAAFLDSPSSISMFLADFVRFASKGVLISPNLLPAFDESLWFFIILADYAVLPFLFHPLSSKNLYLKVARSPTPPRRGQAASLHSRRSSIPEKVL
jgi:hypothetical protein